MGRVYMTLAQNNEKPTRPTAERAVVMVDNLTEDVWPFVAAMENEEVRQFEIDDNAGLTDRNYLAAVAEWGNRLIYISPRPLKSEYVEYVQQLLGVKAAKCLAVPKHEGQTSLECKQAAELTCQLPQEFELAAYCSSPQLYDLVEYWRDQGKKVYAPEMPENIKTWEKTVGIWGTKGGLRIQIEKKAAPELMMVPGQVFENYDEAIQAALKRLISDKAVVIKTNKGHSGNGVVILDQDWVKQHQSHLKQALDKELIKSNGFWKQFPVIVEKYIEADISVGGGMPNIECKVDDEGVKVLYQCGMRVDNGVFSGVEMGRGGFWDKRMQKMGEMMGNWYFKEGYRGYFEVDGIAGHDGRIYITESNVRRTGGTWAYYVARQIVGEKFLERRYYVTKRIDISRGLRTFSRLMKGLEPLLYDHKHKEGVVVNSANLLEQGKLGYMVIGKNKVEAGAIEERMQLILSD